MHRFVYKICKAAFPTVIGLNMVRPIFNNQDTNNQSSQLLKIPKIDINLPITNQISQAKLIKQEKQEKQVIQVKQEKQQKQEKQLKQEKQQKEKQQKEKQVKQVSEKNIQHQTSQNKKQDEQMIQKIKQKQAIIQNKNQNQQTISKTEQQITQQLQRNKQINFDNQAQISQQSPNFIKKYLQIKQIKVKINKNLPYNLVRIKNESGDIITLDIKQNNHAIFKISNFINPVHIVSSQSQMSHILKNMKNDQSLIVTYIPEESTYKNQKKPKSQFDTFTGAEYLDIKKLQREFRNKKYNSGSTKNLFILIRDPEIARTIKMNPNKIGSKYIFYKSTPNQGMEVSALLEGQKFTIKNISVDAPINRDLTQTGIYSYINQIDFDEDMANFLRSVELKKDKRKILVIYSKQRRPQFLKQIKTTIMRTSKTMKQDVLVVMTANEKILRKYFQIIPDDFVTVRLIDTNNYQPPILTLPGFNNSQNKFYSRKILRGQFTIQKLCKFVKLNGEWEQYYEHKQKLRSIQSIVSQNQTIPNNSVILHWKHGCKGCELTLNFLQQIKKMLENIDQNKKFQYAIQKPEILKNVKFLRYNILNQQSHINKKNHDLTPKLILHTNGKQKNLQIGEIISKISAININNYEKIHEIIMTQIIQVITNNIQAKDYQAM